MRTFLKLSDNVYIETLEKAGQHKYVKRLPHPSPKPGRKWIYFYNQQQVKDYKEKGIIPGEEKGGSAWDKLKSFFGGDPKSKVERVKETLFKDDNVSTDVIADHLAEYISNKEKWDSKLNKEKKEPAEKKEAGEKKDKPESGEKKEKTPSRFNLSIMRKIAGQWGLIGAIKKEGSGEKGGEREISLYGNKQKVKTDPVTLDIGFDHPFEIARIDYRSGKKGWMVIESETGLQASTGSTRKEAIIAAENSIKSRSEAEFKKLVDDSRPEAIAKKEAEKKAEEQKAIEEEKDKTAKAAGAEKESPIYAPGAKKLTYGGIDKKAFKDPAEQQVIDILKPKNQIGEQPIKVAFNFSKEGQEAGVWTDARMMIIDKKVSDEIYATNKQREFLRAKKQYPHLSDDEIIKSFIIQPSETAKFPNYKQVIPNDSDIPKKPAEFTGEYSEKKEKDGYNVVKYSDGENEAVFNIDFIASIKSKFPDATMHLTGEMRPAVFKVGGEIKAILMPIKTSDREFKKIGESASQGAAEKGGDEKGGKKVTGNSEDEKPPKDEAKVTQFKDIPKEDKIDKLKSIGGKEWKTDDGKKHRIYFKDDEIAKFYGLEVERYGTGNVSGAWLNGERISNNAANKLLGSFVGSKFHYDLEESKFSANKMADGVFSEVVKKMKEKLGHPETPLSKASALLFDELQKAKKMPIGTVNKQGYKKVAEGKWVKEKKGAGEKQPEGKPEGKPDQKKPEQKKELTDQNKTTIKSALKKMATILADALSGKDTVNPTASAIEETGEAIGWKKKAVQKPKSPEPTPKKPDKKPPVSPEKDKKK